MSNSREHWIGNRFGEICALRITECSLRIADYGLRITDREFQVADYGLSLAKF